MPGAPGAGWGEMFAKLEDITSDRLSGRAGAAAGRDGGISARLLTRRTATMVIATFITLEFNRVKIFFR